MPTAPGQTVYLVGSHPLLGAWVPQSGIQMANHAGSVWTATLSLPVSSSFQYKYVKVDRTGNVAWESGGNRFLATPTSGTVNQNDELAGF